MPRGLHDCLNMRRCVPYAANNRSAATRFLAAIDGRKELHRSIERLSPCGVVTAGGPRLRTGTSGIAVASADICALAYSTLLADASNRRYKVDPIHPKDSHQILGRLLC